MSAHFQTPCNPSQLPDYIFYLFLPTVESARDLDPKNSFISTCFNSLSVKTKFFNSSMSSSSLTWLNLHEMGLFWVWFEAITVRVTFEPKVGVLHSQSKWVFSVTFMCFLDIICENNWGLIFYFKLIQRMVFHLLTNIYLLVIWVSYVVLLRNLNSESSRHVESIHQP